MQTDKIAKIMPLLTKTQRDQFYILTIKMAKIIMEAQEGENKEVVENESSPVTKTTATHR